MHLNLPKPLHGWREFAGEVGVIVLGVLVALGFQQAVEALQWRSDVRDAKAALRDEVGAHYESASEQAMAAPCIDQQLIGLEQALLAPGPYRPVPMYRDQLEYTYRAPSRNWSDDVWHSITSAGTDAHFDPGLRTQLAGHYSQVESLGALSHQAETIFFKMRILARPIQPDAATRTALAEDLEQARGVYGLLAVVSNQLLASADDMGMAPDKHVLAKDLSTSGTLNFCRAHGLPLARPRPEHPR